MKKPPRRRRLRLISAAGAALVAAAVAVTAVVAAESGPSPNTYVPTTSADTSNGEALVKEAIKNLRGEERFRFAQSVTGAGSATDPQSGQVDGEVDLANSATDKPKVRSKVKLKRPDGTPVELEQVMVDEDVHRKVPKQDNSAGSFKKAPNKARKIKGKNPGGGPDEVDVVDPVMQLLEPVDMLPSNAFATPVDSNGDQIWEVQVALPESSQLTVYVDDAAHQVQRLLFVRSGRTADFTLTDFGATDIDVQDPAA